MDAAAALVLAVVAVVSDLSQGQSAVQVLAGVVLCATVALRRRAPVLAIVVAGVASGALGSDDLLVSPVVIALDYYALGRRSAERGWGWWDAVLLSLPIVAIATSPSTPSPGNPLVVDVASVWLFFFVAPFAAGRVVAGRTLLNVALRAGAERLEHEQRERARRAVTQERTRIARELHDVVAHSVSVMVIQTAAARRVAGRDPAAAAQALRDVESCGRDALVDMRRMIGVLHRGDLDLLGGAAPGLSQLGKLVDRARASGLPVELTVEGTARPLSAGLDLVSFRVVQEALTNVIKHAGPAQVRVLVVFTDDHLRLEVLDTGRGPVPPTDPGHGLAGMQERLLLYGGQLQTGRRRGGGFQVLASIPIAAAVPA